jgi:hypothetical protein
MARVQFVTRENAAAIEAPAGGLGFIHSRAYFNNEGDPLRLQVHELTANTVLNIESSDTDMLVYVWKGAVGVQGVRLAERSSLIVECGATAEMRAADESATLLFFTPKGPSPGERTAPCLRLLPRERVPCNRDLGGQGLAGGALHADASPSSCHLWLHENDFYIGGSPVAVHSHSEDEIIFVRDGELRIGNRAYGPGTALAITADTQYGFNAGPTGLSFVNFRASAPTYRSADGSHSMDEAEFWRSQTGRPEYLELPTGRAQTPVSPP